MNGNQRKILIGYLVAIVVVGVWVPWGYAGMGAPAWSLIDSHYGLVFDPPGAGQLVRLDMARLLVEFTVVTIVAAGLFLLAASRKRDGEGG